MIKFHAIIIGSGFQVVCRTDDSAAPEQECGFIVDG
jgi:hypothetical protein